MWIVMRFDRSRRIHFRRKLSFQYLEGSTLCKAENISTDQKKHAQRPPASHCASDHVGSPAAAVIRTYVPPFRQARFRNFRNRLIIVRRVVEKGQPRPRRISKIYNIQRGRFLVEIIAVSSRIESEQ